MNITHDHELTEIADPPLSSPQGDGDDGSQAELQAPTEHFEESGDRLA